MTQHETLLKKAWAASGLSFLGITFARALAIKPIRIALELKVADQTKGKPAPTQSALI